MRGAQNGGSDKVTFEFSLAAVAPLGFKLGRRASEHVVWNITFLTFSQNGVRGAHVNQKQLLSLSSVFKECGLVVSCWH